LISDHGQLNDFIKQLNFELYAETGNPDFLYKGINIHENTVYSRMRSRMDYRSSLQFADVPKAVLDEEHRLKDELQRVVQQGRDQLEVVTDYRESLTQWRLFLQKLEKEHPHYHQMRYAEKTIDFNKLDSLTKGDVTLLRYILSGDGLYVFIMGDGTQRFVS